VGETVESNQQGKLCFQEEYTLFGISYSEALQILKTQIPEYGDVKITLSDETGDLIIGFYTESRDQRHFNRTLKLFKKNFGERILTPPNTSLERRFFEVMSDRKFHVSTAESCTGGLLAARIINVSGSSSIIEEAFITYSEQAKMKVLGVSESVLRTHGVVSEESAGEMARCLKKLTECELCISITGLAGPTGGTPEIPIGTVCFGIALLEEVTTFRKWFSGDRNAVRAKAVSFALAQSLVLLKKPKL
jgi:nicotinamide-nucleotide amidase